MASSETEDGTSGAWPVHLGGESFDPSAGGAGTLVAAWLRAWRSDPERPQIHDPVRGWLTRGTLETASREAAARLDATGLEVGDRVLLSADASAELVIAHAACLRLGLVVVPLNTAYRSDEIAHVIGDARPRAAIVDDPARSRVMREIAPELVLFPPSLDAPATSRASMRRAATPLDAVTPQAPALIGYTSGTTGRPKGAVLSHANLLASAEALRLAWRWTESDRLVLALPLFHMHGLGVGLHGTLHTGASAVLLPRFDPEAVLDAAAEHEASLFFGVPTMYHRLVDHPRARTLAGLRLCVSGSAPLSADLHARFEAATGQRVLERYGMTETVMLVSNPADGERRPGSVGLPLPGVSLRLVGAPAEIQVRGPNVFDGYWERPSANAEAFTEDGWFRTGDLGALDGEGYLRIEGRSKELIISGGYNIYPREVEDALRRHEGIDDVAVVGEPDPEWGERVAAYVVGTSPPGLDRIAAFLEAPLARFKHPRALYHIAELPRNALGKVQKHRLANGTVLAEAAEGAEAPVHAPADSAE